MTKEKKKIKWLKNRKGEIVGCEMKELISMEQLKKYFLDESSDDLF
jgi:hypothetical protein